MGVLQALLRSFAGLEEIHRAAGGLSREALPSQARSFDMVPGRRLSREAQAPMHRISGTLRKLRKWAGTPEALREGLGKPLGAEWRPQPELVHGEGFGGSFLKELRSIVSGALHSLGFRVWGLEFGVQESPK